MGRGVSIWIGIALCAGVLSAQMPQRQTVLRAVTLNGIPLQSSSLDSLTIAPTDTIGFAYACLCPQGVAPPLFEIQLRSGERQQVRSLRADSILYANLPEGEYEFRVRAFSPTEGWDAEPVGLRFWVNSARAQQWKERWLRPSAAPALKQTTEKPAAHPRFAGDGVLPWILLAAGILAGGLLGTWLWLRIRIRRKSARLPMATDGAASLSSAPPTAYDSLLAENSRLKAELNALRGQISALEARSRHLSEENRSLREQVERLRAKQEELEQLQEQKDALFAMVLHDIKNPAMIIRGLVELLRSYDLSAQEQQEIINDIVATSARIVELSQEISRILALEAKVLQLDLQPTDVAELIAAVCRQNKPLADRKSIALLQEVEPDLPLIIADPQRLEEVLDNLVSNGIKYSQPGATVVVRAYARDDKLYIEVEDNGLGMSEEDVRQAFQRGVRLGSKPTGGEPSSGLGLWIVKRLVEAHHGHVRIRSALGKGTTVYVELPLEQPSPQPS
jgi:signal transduction histidine kinase